ncbi:transposase [Paracoccus alcaliphilus]|uniref:Transposase n=1 Tax=Paracoccus alcaliphilus TaxID=34002 RepID=A0A1H8MGA9_9RHOB|nr:transposase [Paracoccus alcaliphilus]SEO16442.1 transposase [Paracoccus alcaliphilus]
MVAMTVDCHRELTRHCHRDLTHPVVMFCVSETLLPGATENEVARRHGVCANHVSSWRTLARKGRLVLPAPEDPVEFAALMVGSTEDAPRADVGGEARPEIIAGAVVTRLEAGATADRIASVVRALATSP